LLASPRNLNPTQRKFLRVMRLTWLAKVIAVLALVVVIVVVGVL
jgi:hypothetical protein